VYKRQDVCIDYNNRVDVLALKEISNPHRHTL